jgi:plastocyanin
MRRLGLLLAVAAAGLVALPTGAHAAGTGIQHLHYSFGPIAIKPGQNGIEFKITTLKPKVDGYIVGFKPNLKRADGSVPPVDVIHLHHGVWLNLSRADTSYGGPERMFAAGEEKTIFRTPRGYGYAYKASDRWLLNYMIHNLTPTPDRVWITYDIDFIPRTAPAARHMRAVHPVWMDVRNGNTYPVFDSLQGTGRNGRYTYPDQAVNPYGGGPPLNLLKLDRGGVLIATAGHLHPGGLYDDLSLTRPGFGATAQASRVRACRAPKRACPSVRGDTVHLFRSRAHYFEPAGAVSWDVSMTATRPDWKVKVRKGDILKISTTYDSRRGSWYEAMGIMVVYMADSGPGRDPFKTKVDYPGRMTHGHLPENDNHGGGSFGLPDALHLADGSPFSGGTVGIKDFIYGAGDLNATGAAGRPPVIHQGQPLTFLSGDAGQGIYHTITACKAPCNRSTGIAYPLANGPVVFDSGELGTGGAPTAGRIRWTTPSNLGPGTYTYFCRIHPFMRGAFRVVQ